MYEFSTKLANNSRFRIENFKKKNKKTQMLAFDGSKPAETTQKTNFDICARKSQKYQLNTFHRKNYSPVPYNSLPVFFGFFVGSLLSYLDYSFL